MTKAFGEHQGRRVGLWGTSGRPLSFTGRRVPWVRSPMKGRVMAWQPVPITGAACRAGPQPLPAGLFDVNVLMKTLFAVASRFSIAFIRAGLDETFVENMRQRQLRQLIDYQS